MYRASDSTSTSPSTLHMYPDSSFPGKRESSKLFEFTELWTARCGQSGQDSGHCILDDFRSHNYQEKDLRQGRTPAVFPAASIVKYDTAGFRGSGPPKCRYPWPSSTLGPTGGPSSWRGTGRPMQEAIAALPLWAARWHPSRPLALHSSPHVPSLSDLRNRRPNNGRDRFGP